MKLALEQAKLALDSLEVPVGCVIIEEQKVISSGGNRTNETRNATRHAEMVAIDELLEQWQRNRVSREEVASNFSKCTLYVTFEPCIMCAAALSIIGIKEVYYGCGNDKFGDCGSILSLHTEGSENPTSPNASQDAKCQGSKLVSLSNLVLESCEVVLQRWTQTEGSNSYRESCSMPHADQQLYHDHAFLHDLDDVISC